MFFFFFVITCDPWIRHRPWSMLQMGLQYLATKRMRCGYEKLTTSGSTDDQKKMNIRVGRRRSWVKSVNGRLRGLRLSRSRKLSLGAFSTVLLSSRRIVRIYTHVANRMNMENIYPTIVLPTQWGLPVLSHPSSVVCRRRMWLISIRNVLLSNVIVIHAFFHRGRRIRIQMSGAKHYQLR